MRRAAIYARFSTDLQNEQSTADQIRLCRSYAKREGLKVVATFEDKAKSGASTLDRDGLYDLLRAASDRQFEVVIVEALDRLSRDMADLASIHKRLTFEGVEIRAVHEGVANTVIVGLRGLVGQLYREDNVHKVRRGMAGLVQKGLSAGGKAYGYRPDPENKGKLLIVEEEAEIVRRIFEEFVSGKSPRKIAHDLNQEGIAAARGKRWNASAINGNQVRGSGIIRNHLYVGKLVWNKIRMVKDPSTGKRVSRENPREQWQTTEVPELRIISDELFEQAQLRREGTRGQRLDQRRRPKRVLSGLLRCGACGSGMSTNGRDRSGRVRIRCTAHAESGNCPDPRTFYLDTVERLVLDGLAQHFDEPELLIEYAKAYEEERKRLSADKLKRRNSLTKRIAALERELSRVIDNIAKGWGDPSILGPRSTEIYHEKQRLEEELRAEPEIESEVVLHPATLKKYAEDLFRLRDLLKDGIDDGNSEAARSLRDIVTTVTVYRDDVSPHGLRVHVAGEFDVLTGPPPQSAPVWGLMVAGEGFEPPTKGL